MHELRSTCTVNILFSKAKVFYTSGVFSSVMDSWICSNVDFGLMIITKKTERRQFNIFWGNFITKVYLTKTS